MLIILVKGIR